MKKIVLIIFFLAAFLERVVYDFGPNIELVTTALILSSFYFGKKEAFWLTFAIMAASDRIIGNSNIFLFTWSGFLIPALFSKRILNHLIPRLKLKLKKISFLLTLTLTGYFSNIFFFFWTNFGVWFLDSWNMYPDTTKGLIMSYINALPFLKNQLISTLIFVPLGFTLIEISKIFFNSISTSINVLRFGKNS